MSYLESPRIVFSGRYQADVSTVNNDVRHFSNAEWEDRFQNPTIGVDQNGWWNPDGTGSFRILDAKVTGADMGGPATAADPVVGVAVASNVDCPPAKLVDLDPQFQFGSMIWGMRLVIGDGEREYLRGDFAPTPFRDLIFGRIADAQGSDAASAKFTSVLENLEWGDAAEASPALAALRKAAEAGGGRLSVSLTTIGYHSSSKVDEFSYGTIVGAIGPWREGEPLFFPAGRRFAQTDSRAGGPPLGTAGFNLNFCDAWVGDGRVSIDLANALPLQDRRGTVTDLGPITLAVLRNPDKVTGTGAFASLAVGTAQNDAVKPDDYVAIGELPYRDKDWLLSTAGIASFDIPPAAAELIAQRPLALIAAGSPWTQTVALRETAAGWFVRADGFEQRVDTGDQPKQVSIDIYALQYGAPLANAAIPVTLDPQASGGGGGPDNEQNPPTAAIPDVNFPQQAIGISASGNYTTGPDGKVTVEISVANPGNPRKYLDGQIYNFSYGFAAANASVMPQVDVLVIHAREGVAVAASPQWSDVEPIFTQYANLYPVMSRRMFDFSDETTAQQRAKILIFALTRPMEDPNHMPVTRDLSAGKRELLLAWLRQFSPTPPPAPPPLLKASLSHAVAPATEMFGAAPVSPAPRIAPLLAFQRLKGMSSEQVGNDGLAAAGTAPSGRN